MNRIMKTGILIPVFSLLLFSCENEERNPSGSYVNFRVNLNGVDNRLAIYHHSETYRIPRNCGEAVGLAGLLIFNSGFDFNASPELRAYDLACPYESSSTVRVVPNKDGQAICEKCQSVYDLQSGGVRLSGPESPVKRLYNYAVINRYPEYLIRN
ncbi:hypothetical protein [Viscerimonas tarda]